MESPKILLQDMKWRLKSPNFVILLSSIFTFNSVLVCVVEISVCSLFEIAWCESCDLDFDLSCRKQTIDRSHSPPPLHQRYVRIWFCFWPLAERFYALTFGLSNEDRDIFIRFPDFSVQFLRKSGRGPGSKPNGAGQWAPYTKSSRKSHFGNSRMQDVYQLYCEHK